MKRTRLEEHEADVLKKWIVEYPSCNFDDFCQANPTIHISSTTFRRYGGKKSRPYTPRKKRTFSLIKKPAVVLYQTIGVIHPDGDYITTINDLLDVVNRTLSVNLQVVALADGTTEIRRTQN
jgi:hypothetical protein